MNATTYRDDHTQLIANRALAYEPKEKTSGFSLDVSYFEQTGDGAVHTSVGDLLKWDENFYTAQVGGKELLGELQEQAKLNNGKILSYAKGLAVSNYRGLRSVRHGGAWGGYRAELLRFPDQHFSVVCLCNLGTANPSARANRVADIFLAGKLNPAKQDPATDDEETESAAKMKAPVTLTADQLKPFEGSYWSDELQVAYRLAAESGALILRTQNSSHALRAIAKDEFELEKEGLKLKMIFGQKDQVKAFTLDAGRTRGMLFEKRD